VIERIVGTRVEAPAGAHNRNLTHYLSDARMTASFLMRMSKHSSTCGRRLETALGTDDDQNTFPADSEYEVL
jgi:hypothetical protein